MITTFLFRQTEEVYESLQNPGHKLALRDVMSLAVLELREMGDLHKLWKKWWYDKGQCPSQGH